MPKQVVLVVHGVGEQEPGETIKQIVGGALSSQNLSGEAPVQVESDQFDLTEIDLPATRHETERRDNTEGHLFPVHTARIKPAAGGESETVFAEVYWADKSPAPVGAFWTIFDLIRMVLGIGYLAMANVENTREKASILLVHSFTWLFFGVIAPLNALLLVGAAVLMLEGRVYSIGFQPENWPSLVLSANAIIAFILLIFATWACFALRGANNYLRRVFGRGMVYLCIFSIGWLYFVDPASGPLSLRHEGFGHVELIKMDLFVAALVALLGLAWAVTVSLSLVINIAWFLGRNIKIDDGGEGHRQFFAPICSAMVLLWMVLAPAFWQAVQYVAVSWSPTNEAQIDSSGLLGSAMSHYLGHGAQTMAISVVFILLLIFVVGVVMLQRRRHKATLHRKSSAISRLLLNGPMQVVFTLSNIAIWITVLHLIELRPGNELCLTIWFAPIYGFLNSWVSVFSAGLLFLALLTYYFANEVSNILGILRDVVVYSTMSGCSLIKPKVIDNYQLRAEIESRFDRVCRYIIQAEKPDALTILSHSQGTVLVTRWLTRYEVGEGLLPAETTFVTMGSPVTHLFRKYFKNEFPIPADAFKSKGVDWYNIFRRDDFVGTYVECLKEGVTDFDIPAGGHTGYFTDAYVWNILRNKISFSLIS